MLIKDLTKVKCCFCMKRGDRIGRNNLRCFDERSIMIRKQSICQFLLLDPNNINKKSIVCTKHLIKYYKQNTDFNNNQQDSYETNHLINTDLDNNAFCDDIYQ